MTRRTLFTILISVACGCSGDATGGASDASVAFDTARRDSGSVDTATPIAIDVPVPPDGIVVRDVARPRDTSVPPDLGPLGPPAQLGFATPPQTVLINTCSGAVSLQSQDRTGRATTATTALSIMLSGGMFFSDPGCRTPVSSVAIAPGSSTATFYFRSATPGTVVVRVQSTGLQAAEQTEFVNAVVIDVPITVQEALYPATVAKNLSSAARPVAATGIARTNEPFTVGIPLPDAWGVESTAQLGLSGAALGQFEILARWPNGHAKWVLVDSQVPALAAGSTSTVRLVAGTGSFGGTSIAADGSDCSDANPDFVCVDTGAAQFAIRKSRFNIFDSVNVGSKTIVAPGTSQGVVVTGPAYPATTCASPPADCVTEYRSSNDALSTAVIETNGPARAVVRADGALKDALGNVYLRFTVRTSFYRGRTDAKVDATLRNADAPGGVPAAFASATKGMSSYELRVNLGLTGARSARFGTHTTPVAVSVPASGTDSAYLYQAYSTNMQSSDWLAADVVSFIPRTAVSGPYAQEGYQVVNRTTVDRQGTPDQYPQGWADIADASGAGALVGVYQMAAYWPKSLQFMNGGSDARIGLWPDQNLMRQTPTRAVPYYTAWPQYKMDEVHFKFHDDALAEPGRDFLTRERFLIGRAPREHYNLTGVFPVTLMDPEEEDDYYREIAAAARPAISASRGCCATDFHPTVTHRYGWGGGSVTNQSDFRWMYLLEFITRGFTGRYLWAHHFNRHIMEASYPRADFPGGWLGHTPISDLNVAGFPARIPSANLTRVTERPWVDALHDHAYGIIDWYFATGDRAMLDFIKDAFPSRYFQFGACLNRAIPGGCQIAQREVGIKLIFAARLEEFFRSIGDTANADRAVTLGENMLTTITPDLAISSTGVSATTNRTYGWGTYGTSRTRGFYFPDVSATFTTATPFSALTCTSSAVNAFPGARTSQPYQVSIVVQGLYELARIRGPGWSKYELARDLAYGMAQWATTEGAYDNGDWQVSGMHYAMPADHLCPGARNTNAGPVCECTAGYGWIATVWYHWFFLQDYAGDASQEGLFRRNLQKIMSAGGPNTFEEHSGYAIANAMHFLRHPTENARMVSVDVTATSLAGGMWRLTWTPPAGTIVRYRLKHGQKIIVPWLEYDITDGTFGYDPTTHMAWFAADEAPTQPAIGDASITVSGLPATGEHFALRAFVDD